MAGAVEIRVSPHAAVLLDTLDADERARFQQLVALMGQGSVAGVEVGHTARGNTIYQVSGHDLQLTFARRLGEPHVWIVTIEAGHSRGS